MQVTDGVIGFDKKIETSGNGLKNMQRRAEELKETTYIDTSSKGTIITCCIPIK